MGIVKVCLYCPFFNFSDFKQSLKLKMATKASRKVRVTTDQFYTKAAQIQNTLTYGSSIDDNYRGSNYFEVGSGYTQGQSVRSLVTLNDNALTYDSTEEDNSYIINKYPSIFNLYPNLSNYPFLSIAYDITTSDDVPIFRVPGKGIGRSEFYGATSSTSGNYRLWEETAYYYTNIFRGRISITQPLNETNGPRWPYSGLLYSGNLVQFTGAEGGVQVMTYQNGRGIPQYDPFQEYFSGDAYCFGSATPKDPSSGLTLSPELSMGCVPGNNDICMGVSIDTMYHANEKMYKYPSPNSGDYNTYDLNIWGPVDSHPAPFTREAQNISFTRSERFYSPENSNNDYYAPWPKYYAYENNQPVPVLNQGPVTCRIGAAFNIGAQAYYEPDVVEGDEPRGNPNYVAVSCVPLFQGEEVSVGSYVYANCLGHIITPEPVGTTPYPVASYDDASGNIPGIMNPSSLIFPFPRDEFQYIHRDARRDNPWYDWFDTTYGATGYTGTPNFLLSGIPDIGSAIIQTRNDDASFPYINQSNQGSIIVQARTLTNPLDSNGSGRMVLIGAGSSQETASLPAIDDPMALRFSRITKFIGYPERALCVGNTLQKITGTGQWTYTGSMIGFEQETFVNGYGYIPELIDGTVIVPETSTSSGVTYEILGDNSVILNSAGTGVNGELYMLQRFSIITQYGRGTLSSYGNSRIMIYPDSETFGGSRYISSSYEETVNVSANNLLVLATCTDGAVNMYLLSQITSVSVFAVDDLTRYPVGTIFRIMNNSNRENWAKCIVTGNDGVTLTISLLPVVIYQFNASGGGRNVYDIGTYVYSTMIEDFENPTVSITTESDYGSVTTVRMLTIPPLNRESDLILVNQPGSDKNCIFELSKSLDLVISYKSSLIKGGAYYWKNPLYYTDSFMYTYSTVGAPFDLAGPFNSAELYQNGVDTGTELIVGNITNLQSGQITQVSYFPNITTFTGTFGSIGTVRQIYPVAPYTQEYPSTTNTQPVAGLQPDLLGWPSYIVRNTATFIIDVRFLILEQGTDYVAGDTYDVLGGSGIGMTVTVISAISGAITKLQIADYGVGYTLNDKVTIDGGGNDCIVKLKLPVSREVDGYYQDDSPERHDKAEPILYFDLDIIEPGTGYSVGIVDTECPVYDINFTLGFRMQIRIIEVSGTGAIIDAEMVLPLTDPENDTYWEYQVGYRVTIPNDGNGDAVIQLNRPLKPSKMIFTSGGSGYTTGTGISTYNLTQNNLATICGLDIVPGECQVIDYSTTFYVPTFWDLSRYDVGDILAFDQLGNQTATAEITLIDQAQSLIEFNQLTPGVGYFAPPSGDYAFLPTVNLTKTATTVSIETNAITGAIENVTIDSIGVGAQVSDKIVVSGGDENALFELGPEKDIPAPWQPFINGRQATATEWNEYKTVLKSSVNLLDKPLTINFSKMYPNYYDNSWYYYGNPDNKDPYTTGYTEWPNES